MVSYAMKYFIKLWLSVAVGSVVMFFALVGGLQVYANTPRSVITIRKADNKTKTVTVRPMYTLDLAGEVIKGSFTESQQVDCKIVNRKTGQKVTVPGNDGTEHVLDVTIVVMVCKNGGEIRVDHVLFPEE